MLDWVGRTLLLILSGLATFALFASFTTISSGPDRTPPRPQPGEATAPETAPIGRPAPIEQRRTIDRDSPVAAGEGGAEPIAGAIAVPRAPDAVARWLEALTYATLALAGFVAAGLIVLLRIAGHLGQIARRG